MRDFDPYQADEQAKEAFQLLSTMTNTMRKSALNDLAILMARDHRTLQQGFMRDLVVPLLEIWAEDFEEKRFDLRNEGTTRAAHVMVNAFKEANIPLPFV